MEEIDVLVTADGPLIIKGKINLIDIDGSVTKHEKRCILCRCGASNNKPFCDGMHKMINFTDNLNS